MHVLLCSFMRKGKRVESGGSFYLNSECQDRTCGLWSRDGETCEPAELSSDHRSETKIVNTQGAASMDRPAA